jgi:hypothetical protein
MRLVFYAGASDEFVDSLQYSCKKWELLRPVRIQYVPVIVRAKLRGVDHLDELFHVDF